MRILKRVDGSVLWLLRDNEEAERNLRREAERRGVANDRLVFAPRVSSPLHLARHRAADLFLDTLPYNAHTTASDALWAGLPVLTCAGRSFAARVAASLLKAVDLPELVTDTLTQYEDRAVQLAQDASELEALKKRLAASRLSCPLFNTRLFARHVETAYQMVCDRYRGGLAPEDIFIGDPTLRG